MGDCLCLSRLDTGRRHRTPDNGWGAASGISGSSGDSRHWRRIESNSGRLSRQDCGAKIETTRSVSQLWRISRLSLADSAQKWRLVGGFERRILACVSADAAAFSASSNFEYHKIGWPRSVVAPRGGHAQSVRSTDEGRTCGAHLSQCRHA